MDLAYQQHELEQICPDRELQTSEFHTPNDYYGQASVLKRYCGLDEDYWLRGVLEHGLVLDERMWDYDRDQQLPWILASSTLRAVQLQQLCSKPAVPIGFGFLYAKHLVELERPTPENATREGTIIFPCHSTHTVTAKYDHAEYARRIRELPDALQPVSVCLYWRNYEFGHHEIYQRLGIPVYSAGHMFDSNFLLRFYDLCRHFRYSASNSIGTHYFQSIASGCHYFQLPSGGIRWDVPDLKREGASRGTPLGEFQSEIEESSFCGWEDIDIARQRAVANRLLGATSMLSPSELKTVLQQAEWADRLSPTRVRLGGMQIPAPPTYVRRSFRFVGRIRRSIKKRLPWRKAA